MVIGNVSSLTQDQEYEFELNWNCINGHHRLYIDGISTTAYEGSCTRTASTTLSISIGDNLATIIIRDMMIFAGNLHTSNHVVGDAYIGGKTRIRCLEVVSEDESVTITRSPNIIRGGLVVAKSLIVGGLLTKGGGSFLINHPDPLKQGWKLRHCFVESPNRGDNIYRFVTITQNLAATIVLPSYFSYLNENQQIFVSANNCLGYGYGTMDEALQNVMINVSMDGTYNVMVIATRKDQLMKDYWDQYGAEIPPGVRS